jgi:gamma-glutamyl-gamma-aminobutyrate hydrolase PuuD
VQAVEPRGAAWVLGVQFHPEEDDRDIRLFEALLAATGPTQGHHP